MTRPQALATLHAMTPNPRQALLLDAVRALGTVSVEARAERFEVT